MWRSRRRKKRRMVGLRKGRKGWEKVEVKRGGEGNGRGREGGGGPGGRGRGNLREKLSEGKSESVKRREWWKMRKGPRE